MSRLSYHLPNFTYPDTPTERLLDAVVAQVAEAEAAGFDRVTVMDHVLQVPVLGRPDEPMLEGYTLLSALAQHTRRVRLATFVTGVTYRNPALLAKQVATLDVVSRGRATLGIGAAWYEAEHRAFGFDFGTTSERFEKLDEALQIAVPMLRGASVTVDGRHHRAEGACLHPAPLSRVPVVIGGSGERKTLRLAARYADESNLLRVRTADEIAHKLDVLAAHCDAVGRDRTQIRVTALFPVTIAPTMEQADADLARYVALKGWGEEQRQRLRAMSLHGDPDTVGQKVADVLAGGLDGIAVSLSVNAFVPGRIRLFAETAQRALG